MKSKIVILKNENKYDKKINKIKTVLKIKANSKYVYNLQ